jgi:hypothetical protein
MVSHPNTQMRCRRLHVRRVLGAPIANFDWNNHNHSNRNKSCPCHDTVRPAVVISFHFLHEHLLTQFACIALLSFPLAFSLQNRSARRSSVFPSIDLVGRNEAHFHLCEHDHIPANDFCICFCFVELFHFNTMRGLLCLRVSPDQLEFSYQIFCC